jgi:hypothetical protein
MLDAMIAQMGIRGRQNGDVSSALIEKPHMQTGFGSTAIPDCACGAVTFCPRETMVGRHLPKMDTLTYASACVGVSILGYIL